MSSEEEEEDEDAEQGFDSAEERAKVWWSAARSMAFAPDACWSSVLQDWLGRACLPACLAN